MTRGAARGASSRSGTSPKVGRFSDDRTRWLVLEGVEAVQYISDDREVPEKERWARPYSDIPGMRVTLAHPGRRANSFTIQLTVLTAEELDALQNFMNDMFDEARSHCVELDARAQKELEDGNDSQPRLYRRVPVVHERQRAPREHDGGLSEGSGEPS